MFVNLRPIDKLEYQGSPYFLCCVHEQRTSLQSAGMHTPKNCLQGARLTT